MSILIVCPLAGTEGHNGSKGEGYTVGGAASHATRCAEMAEVIGVPAPVARGPRGPQTLGEAITAARAKFEAKSAPVADATAAERIAAILAGK